MVFWFPSRFVSSSVVTLFFCFFFSVPFCPFFSTPFTKINLLFYGCVYYNQRYRRQPCVYAVFFSAQALSMTVNAGRIRPELMPRRTRPRVEYERFWTSY